MTNILPNGIGATVGDSLVTASTLYTTKPVWYVDSVTGNASYPGDDRKTPFPTIAAAWAAVGSVDDNIIVLLDTHSEVITTALTINKRITFVGEGSSGGDPTATLILNGATNHIFNCTASRVRIRGIYFKPPGTQTSPLAASGSYINITQTVSEVIGCRFDSDKYSDGPALTMSASATDLCIRNCKFVSTETSTASTDKPDSAVRVSSLVTGLTLDACTFDGGTVGYENSSNESYAFDNNSQTLVGLRASNISLLHGADFAAGTGASGYITTSKVTGSSKVIFG